MNESVEWPATHAHSDQDVHQDLVKLADEYPVRKARERNGLHSTAHVGLALRRSDGVLHFMHASSPSNYGRVVIDDELSKYLYRYGSDSGVLVARPLR